jgi:hypothetical protein
MRHLALVLLLATSAFAQNVRFHEAMPLTDTRYGRVDGGNAQLVTNGTDTFLFWNHGAHIVVTKLDGEKRVARVVSSATGNLAGVVWNGSTFIVGIEARNTVFGQLLDRNAEPIGGAFATGTGYAPAMTARGTTTIIVSARPRLAFVEVSPAGRPGDEIVLSQSAANSVAVASNGKGFAVAINDQRGSSVIVLDSANRIAGEHMVVPRQSVDASVSIASDGRDYVMTSHEGAGDVLATAVGSNTFLGRTLRLGPANAWSLPEVAWDGNAYVVVADVAAKLRVDRIDARAEIVTESRVVEDASGIASACLCAGSLKLAWRNSTRGFDALDLTTDAITHVTYGAASQMLLATASSSEGTLVVWQEGVDGEVSLRAGLRRTNGSWIEREIGGRAVVALAASNGTEFAVVRHMPDGTDIVRLDRDLRIVATAQLASYFPYALASNGTDFALLGIDKRTRTLIAERWSGTGAVAAPVVLLHSYEWVVGATLASNGSTYLAAWQLAWIGFPPAEPNETRVQPLGADLRPMTAQPVLAFDGHAPAAAWNGTHYVLGTWDRDELPALSLRTLTPAGNLVRTQPLQWTDESFDFTNIHVVTSGGISMFTWLEPTASYELKLRAAFADKDGWVIARQDVGPVPGNLPRVTGMTNGRFGVVYDMTRAEAPHHAANRIMIRIADTMTLQKPDAPKNVTVRRYNGQFRIEWTPPAQPVDGYRVEYKIGDGQWLELGRWFDPDERVAAWPSVKAGVTYSFRVRAWSAAGTSAYSAVATGSAATKRRAVN